LLEHRVSHSALPERVRRLRTGNLKQERETRDALIFAHGMSAVCGAKVLVSPGEVEDCDFITKCTLADTDHFTCVQLKELAPEDLSPSQTLEPLFHKLQSLPASDAVLAIHLNRRTTMQLEELAGFRAPFAELWFYWQADETGHAWKILGDILGSPRLVEFTYPE
jgi:hypothetical protein